MLRDFFIQSPILNFKDHDKEVIFMNIPQLIEFHQTFYSKISDYISKHIQQQTRRLSLGSLFCENKNEFLIYSVFCCDLPKGKFLFLKVLKLYYFLQCLATEDMMPLFFPKNLQQIIESRPCCCLLFLSLHIWFEKKWRKGSFWVSPHV